MRQKGREFLIQTRNSRLFFPCSLTPGLSGPAKARIPPHLPISGAYQISLLANLRATYRLLDAITTNSTVNNKTNPPLITTPMIAGIRIPRRPYLRIIHNAAMPMHRPRM